MKLVLDVGNANKLKRKEVEENNAAIASFLGWQQDGRFERFFTEPESGDTYSTGDGDVVTQMKFHKSWDWLMPVVDKIEEDTDIKVNITANSCVITDERVDTDHSLMHTVDVVVAQFVPESRYLDFSKFFAVYTAVVRYLKWRKEIDRENIQGD